MHFYALSDRFYENRSDTLENMIIYSKPNIVSNARRQHSLFTPVTCKQSSYSISSHPIQG